MPLNQSNSDNPLLVGQRAQRHRTKQGCDAGAGGLSAHVNKLSRQSRQSAATNSIHPLAHECCRIPSGCDCRAFLPLARRSHFQFPDGIAVDAAGSKRRGCRIYQSRRFDYPCDFCGVSPCACGLVACSMFITPICILYGVQHETFFSCHGACPPCSHKRPFHIWAKRNHLLVKAEICPFHRHHVSYGQKADPAHSRLDRHPVFDRAKARNRRNQAGRRSRVALPRIIRTRTSMRSDGRCTRLGGKVAAT